MTLKLHTDFLKNTKICFISDLKSFHVTSGAEICEIKLQHQHIINQHPSHLTSFCLCHVSGWITMMFCGRNTNMTRTLLHVNYRCVEIKSFEFWSWTCAQQNFNTTTFTKQMKSTHTHFCQLFLFHNRDWTQELLSVTSSDISQQTSAFLKRKQT